jgi:hypothetical protein
MAHPSFAASANEKDAGAVLLFSAGAGRTSALGFGRAGFVNPNKTHPFACLGDVAVETLTFSTGRRGVAGTLIV